MLELDPPPEDLDEEELFEEPELPPEEDLFEELEDLEEDDEDEGVELFELELDLGAPPGNAPLNTFLSTFV